MIFQATLQRTQEEKLLQSASEPAQLARIPGDCLLYTSPPPADPGYLRSTAAASPTAWAGPATASGRRCPRGTARPHTPTHTAARPASAGPGSRGTVPTVHCVAAQSG